MIVERQDRDRLNRTFSIARVEIKADAGRGHDNEQKSDGGGEFVLFDSRDYVLSA